MSTSSLHESATTEISGLAPTGFAEKALRETILAFLSVQPDACMRRNVPAHVTASAVVLSADLSHTVLTLHPRVGEWLQLGGHCEEEDETVPGAALREAREESGISALTLMPHPFGIDAVPITCSLGRPTRHIDIRYVAIATQRGLPGVLRSAESTDLRWWPVNDLPESAARTSVADQVRAAVAMAGTR